MMIRDIEKLYINTIMDKTKLISGQLYNMY